MARIEEDDAELPHRARAVLRQQKSRHLMGGDELRPVRRCQLQRPAAELDACQQSRRQHRTDARARRELVSMYPRQAVHAAEGREQPIGDAQRARARGAVTNHNRQQLVVAERGCAGSFELFARSVVGRKVFHSSRFRHTPRYTALDASSRLLRAEWSPLRCLLGRPA